jgi:hypothetical protein
MSGKADEAFLDRLPENITASTDDNPFFFYTARAGEIFNFGRSLSMNNNAAISMTHWLLLLALLACVYYIVIPFLRLAKQMPLSALTPPVTYFSAIGMGFMLIEISQMQRLMVFLGHPVYGLSVVLFTILLFSGLGSSTVGAAPPRSTALLVRLVALLAALVTAGLLTPWVTTWTRSEATEMRIVVSVLLLAPPAFCMGMMFPLGLNIWRRHAGLLPFFWSTNGITSVLASILGMALSIEFGIARTYALGVCCYVLCAAVMVAASRLTNPAGSSASEPILRPGLVARDEAAS